MNSPLKLPSIDDSSFGLRTTTPPKNLLTTLALRSARGAASLAQRRSRLGAIDAIRKIYSAAALALTAVLLAPLSARADVHSGSWAAKATLGGPTYTQLYGVANVAQNTFYTASIWVKGSGTMRLIVNNPSWTYFPVSIAVTATNTWTQINLPTFSSSTNTQLLLRFYDEIGSGSGSIMYIDDGFLGVSGGSNLLGNSGLESGNTGWAVGTAFSIGQFGTSGPPLANGTYTLTPANATSERLDVSGAGTANGTNVQIWSSNGTAAQQWIFTNITGNVYRLSPACATTKGLDVNGVGTASSTNVQIWNYVAGANQLWAVTAVSGGYTLNPLHATGLRLNATGTVDSANVNVTTANGSAGQTWNIVLVGGGSPPPPPPPAPAPTLLSATSGNAQVILGWSASSGAVSYNVYRGTSPNNASPTLVQSAITATSFTQTGLTNGTAYFFKVAAVNSAGTSGFSNELSATPTSASETIGGGTISSPAVGPAASFNLGSGFTLVKNWNFGANGTIKNITDMSANFFYHDQFGTIGNGANYGGITVAPDAANAITDFTHGPQPVENGGSVPIVRTFTADSVRTLLVPLNGATTVAPTLYNVGCGSFMAKFSLPNGGALLNQDLLWETRVRMVTPPYFWFAIWNSGNMWDGGAEEDVVESFGYDNGGGNTNFDGRFFHSNSVGGSDADGYPNWGSSMAAHGIPSFDATQYHTWTWLYRKDNTYSVYVDGVLVNNGTINWRLSGSASGAPINLSFLFDASWGHIAVSSVNHSMPASNLAGKFYEWDYSRVYLKN